MLLILSLTFAVGFLASYAVTTYAARTDSGREIPVWNGGAASSETYAEVETRQEKVTSDTIRSITPEEEAMVKLLNQERAKAGLPELELDLVLVALARAKSDDMVTANYFGHLSEKLGTVYQQLAAIDYQYQAAVENLVTATNVFKAHELIMQSQLHRSNVLNENYQKVGVGISKGADCGKMITQIFVD